MKTAKLTGALLDYWVAKAEGVESPEIITIGHIKPRQVCQYIHHYEDGDDGRWNEYSPHSEWSIGGPIIERERINVECANIKNHLRDEFPEKTIDDGTNFDFWRATILDCNEQFGVLPLEAAMRAYVASKYGKTVPDEVQS